MRKDVFQSHAYPLGYFWHSKVGEILTTVSFCVFEKLYSLNLERGADFGRSRLVLSVHAGIFSNG